MIYTFAHYMEVNYLPKRYRITEVSRITELLNFMVIAQKNKTK